MAPHTRGPFFGVWGCLFSFLLFIATFAFNMGTMHRELLLGDQKIVFDREGTLILYRDQIKAGEADHCDCAGCKNFVAQRGNAYPQHFLLLLNELGADPDKEWEAFDYDFETSPGYRLYGGWFLFSGEIVEGATVRPGTKPFSYWFTTSFPNATFRSDAKLCAVEFCAEIYWNPPKSWPPSKH